MSDRIVYVCGCGGHVDCVIDENHEPAGLPWDDDSTGVFCHTCDKPVTAVNIDRLLRIEAAAELLDLCCDAVEAGEVYGADRLIEALKESGHE